MREWSVGYEVASYIMQSMETGEVINSDNHLDLLVRAVYINLFTLGLMNMFTNSAFVSAVTLVSSQGGKTLGNVSFGLNQTFSCLFSFISVSVMNDETSKKKAILVGDHCVVGFAACNWYVSYSWPVWNRPSHSVIDVRQQVSC